MKLGGHGRSLNEGSWGSLGKITESTYSNPCSFHPSNLKVMSFASHMIMWFDFLIPTLIGC